MNTNSMHEMLNITTLDELLACNGQKFVRSAFQTILGREPDPEGLAYYIARLRAGYSKMRTVQQLRLSKEGFANEVRLPGLDASISRYRRGQFFIIGWLFRVLDGTESNSAAHRKIRGIENKFLLYIESNDGHDLQDVENKKKLQHMENNRLNAAEQLKSVSKKANDVYFELKKTSDLNAKEKIKCA